MGQDKALLMIEGQPLLQRICQIASGLAESVYVVTPWGDRYREILPTHCQIVHEYPLSLDTDGSISPTFPTSLTALDNPKKQTQGPLLGFAQGLSRVKTEWVLLLACDLPKLRLEPLQVAIAHLEQVPAEAIAFLPRDEKGWQPLCGFYRHSCKQSLQAFIQQGGRSFQPWLATQQVEEWQVSDRQILFNCNTPDDWLMLLPPTQKTP
jgi:molybdopterin-guanine dinucleotide biosynthesis protein A